MVDLKPCPCCGYEARLVRKDHGGFVHCTKCRLVTRSQRRWQKAVANWNLRTEAQEQDDLEDFE